jgi:hypothetical protein
MLTSIKTKNSDLIRDNKVFVWVAIGTLLVLLVPFALMTLKIPLLDPGSGYEVLNWSLTDFFILGVLLFGTGSTFIFVARRIDKKYRIVLGVLLSAILLWFWAELAVGIFTNLGS